ncbi:MAG TPA: ATP-dependent DNA helicase [Candidatus Dormibacteraeota bacterium]|nr:ATP-dependent DNA helicase [Candidatus Dormibacteraeota bacterium]
MAQSKSNFRPTPFTPDDRQREAIEHVHGPMLVIAGAGTGKTSVLVNRIVRLVKEGHAKPEEILALTYTRNSAAELKERVDTLSGTTEVHTATFHDYCLDLLKRANRDFGVLDEADLWIYLRRRLRDLRLEYFVRAANVGEFLKDLLQFLSRCHDELVTPEKYGEYVEKLEREDLPIPRVAKSSKEIDDQEVLGRCHEIARVFRMTERWLNDENLGTFSHMITRAQSLLESDPSVLARARARARFILVDEFQDVNFAQVKLLANLAGPEGNIFAVGDPDQAIYRFRGASSAAFDLFYRQFPSAQRVILGINRRSRTPILRCAFTFIDKNPPAFAGKHSHAIGYERTPLQSARDLAGDASLPPAAPVEGISFATREAEAADVVQTIKILRKKLHCRWSDFGVLYRQHPHRDALVRELVDARVPFIIENMDVSDTPEVRDLFACLSVVIADGDDVSLVRVAALPQFRVDPTLLRGVTRALASQSRDSKVVPLATRLSEVPGGAAILSAITAAREEIEKTAAKGRRALEIVAARFQLDISSPILGAAMKFVDNWQTKKINRTTDLAEFLDYMTLFREAGGVLPLESDVNEDAVRLMTAHLAKGLEFPHVFILRATSSSFPLSYRETLVEFPNDLRDPDSAGEGDSKVLHNEDERRLFYVAMTRARDTLHIYGKQGIGRKDPTPPGPIRELLLENSLRTMLVPRNTLGSPADLFAGESPGYPEPTRLCDWLNLTATEGLHLQLSASAVDTYERCPLQFKLARDWRLAVQPAAAMQYGASMHRVLRTYFDSVRLGRPRTEQQLIDDFRNDLAGAGLQDAYQYELYEKQGIAQLKDFFAKAQSSAPPEVLHTEEWFEIKLGETRLTGRIDRMDRAADGSVIVVDYKTGKARDQEDADGSLQLSIYALAAREKWGYDVHSLVFHNLEGNVPVSTSRTDSELRIAGERVAAAAEKIAAGNFKPKVDFHCSFCSFRALCPAKERHFPNLGKANAEN